jgi:hypothetical protein
MPQTDNTCAQCNGYGWDESYEDRHPCYHCRTTGKCDCEECHSTTEEDTRTDGWSVLVTTAIYNDMDSIVGQTTVVAAVFTSEHCADEYADKFILDGDCSDLSVQVKPCKFEVYHEVL